MLFVVVYLSALLSAPDVSPFCIFRISPSSSGLIQLFSVFCCLEAVTRRLRIIYWESSRKNTLVRCVPEKGIVCEKHEIHFFCGKPTVSGEIAANRIKNQKLTGNRRTRNGKNLFQSKFWSSGTHRPSPRGGMGLWLIDFWVDKYPYPYIFYNFRIIWNLAIPWHPFSEIDTLIPLGVSPDPELLLWILEVLQVEEYATFRPQWYWIWYFINNQKISLGWFPFCELQRLLPWRSETVPSPFWQREQLV